jgi:hypothetical protein
MSQDLEGMYIIMLICMYIIVIWLIFICEKCDAEAQKMLEDGRLRQQPTTKVVGMR